VRGKCSEKAHGLSGSCYFVAMLASVELADGTSSLSRVPPWFRHTISRRGEWKLCALERSCFGPMHDPTPEVPFHHLGVRLDHAPLKMGWILDGRRADTNLPFDHVSVIPAGASLRSWWNRPTDFACLYFRPEALTAAVGEEMASTSRYEIRPALSVESPTICNLVRALHVDAAAEHPYGKMAGDAIFIRLASLLVSDGRILQERGYRDGIGDWRIRRALEYIHTNLYTEMDLFGIAAASETSPFHLSRLFRKAVGCSPWQYVSRMRVQIAMGLMRDGSLSLTQISTMSGFESYSTFATTFKASRGVAPAHFRAGL
jgi:AraC-like DNA-binding protein